MKTCEHTYAQSDNGKRCIKCNDLLKPTDDEIRQACKARTARYKSTGWKIITA